MLVKEKNQKLLLTVNLPKGVKDLFLTLPQTEYILSSFSYENNLLICSARNLTAESIS